MSAVVEPTERTTFVRTFATEIIEGDGRTLDVRIVPFGVPALVVDPPDPTPYQEAFVPGAFERQVSAPDRVRVWLNFEHEQGLRGIVGHGIALAERADGLYGSFRVHPNADGDKALQLVNDGLLTGLSMEFAALRSRVVDGVVQRLRAHIDKVSLCRFPAYAAAQVLAVREEPDEVEEETPPPVPHERIEVPRMASALADRLEALGFVPTSREPREEEGGNR